jgi:SOS-response transcriptional repressor LexA
VIPQQRRSRALSARQTQVVAEKCDRIVAFIEARWQARQVPPTLQEIADECGLTSKAHASQYLERLVKAGRIEIITGDSGRMSPRGIRIIRQRRTR